MQWALIVLPLFVIIAAVASESDDVELHSSVVDHEEDVGGGDLTVELHRSLRFEPPQLDFGTWAVGTAHAHTVTLVNQNTNRSVYLSSVSGRTPAFYSSFFEAKVVPPQGNTTFSVVFLPRAHGTIASDLMVHTSFGQARLLVRGEGRECPYRLKPIVGVRAPLNATLTPEIHMYNPHERPLQILEVYSSGGQFQLELPSGGQEGPQALWTIPAHTEKPVIRIRFQGRNAGNHTAYIRIKISEQPEDALAASENVLVIPVEFEILPQHGLYAENPVLDFGRLTTTTVQSGQNKPPPPLRLHLALRQSHERRPHEITGYEVGSSAGLSFDAATASLTLDPALFAATTSVDTTLRLHTASKRNASQTLELTTLLVRAEVFKGTLMYDRNATIFITQHSVANITGGKRRTLVVRNDFEHPLALLNVSSDALNASSTFARALQLRLSDEYAAGIILAPGKSLSLLQLQLLMSADVNFRTTLRIHTNVTHFELPLIVCPGLLHVSTRSDLHVPLLRPPEDVYNLELNLGTIPLAEMSQNGFIVLRNPNPLTIKLSNWDFQSPQGVYFHTTFLGCLRTSDAISPAQSNSSETTKNESGSDSGVRFKFCSHLEEGDVAVFQVAIQSYITDDYASGTLKLWTAYETITTTVKFRTWMGKLEVDQEQLYFKNCFPGKLCSSDLSIRSTFKHPIHIDSINFTDAGLRFEDFQPKGGSTIAPDAVTKVGRIYFEPAQLCQNRCYIPQDDKSAAISFPAAQETKGGVNNNLHFDETELRRRTELFRHLKWYFQTIAFTLNSREVRQFQLQLIIDIEWPKLVEGGRQTLPTIEVGKIQQIPVVLSNPADSPILIDYFLADPRFAKTTQLSLPFEVVDISTNCYLTDKTVFSLVDSVASRRQPVLVPAHSSIAVGVRFVANEADTHCTLLHIRNNLTLYEAVWLIGKTVQSQFRFGNRKPGSSTPLLFEVSEKYLAACTASLTTTTTTATTIPDDLSDDGSGSVTVTKPLVFTKRTFTARNTGEIPIWIETFLIGDQPCEGYGFRVLDCTSFELKANASKKIEIAFRPDFTALRVTRPLTLRTNLSYDVEYVLLAQLPPIGLDQCVERLPRPSWEQHIRNAAVVLLATTFVLVVVAAHVDHNAILAVQSKLYASRDKAPMHGTFNLRTIATNKASAVTAQASATEDTATTGTQAAKNKIIQQQQRPASGSGGGNTKKRIAAAASSVKKPSINGASGIGRNMTLSDLQWPLNLSPTNSDTGGGAKITTPTFSERNFKLRLEAEKAAVAAAAAAAATSATTTVAATAQPGSNSNCNSTSNESSAKSIPPPPPPKTIPTPQLIPAAVIATTSEKESAPIVRKQRGGKKFKNYSAEKTAEEQRSVSQQKTANGQKNTKVSTEKSTQITATVPNEAPTSKIDSVEQEHVSPPRTFVNKDCATRGGKHGKTPGRERRKDAAKASSYYNASAGGDASSHLVTASSCSTSSASSSSSGEVKRGGASRKHRNRATCNALLNFGSGPAGPTSTPFESSGGNNGNVLSTLTLSSWQSSTPISFSDVLQLSTPNSPTDLYFPENSRQLSSTGSEHALLDIDLSRNQSGQLETTTARTASNTPDRTNNCTELGPIGSKKSPSSTPVWENIAATAAASAQQLPKPISISNNSSFFSNLLPTTSSSFAGAYEGPVQPSQFIGMQTGLYELKKAQEDLQRQWQNNEEELQRQWQNKEYILSMHQQRQHAQQQQQQQLIHNGSSSGGGGNVGVGIDSLGNWTTLNSLNTWTPMMGYGNGSGGSGSGATNVMNPTAISAAGGGTVTAATVANSALGPWQNVTGVGSGGVVRPPPGLEANYQNVIQQVAAPADNGVDVLPPQANTDNMQTFDPFSSLSSIWSDNWNKQPNQRNN